MSNCTHVAIPCSTCTTEIILFYSARGSTKWGKSPPPGLDQTIKGCVNLYPGLLKGCEKFLVQKSGLGMGFKGYENIVGEI